MNVETILTVNTIIDNILNDLNERKSWAENGRALYYGHEELMEQYQSRIEEIENAIYIVGEYKLKI